MSGCLPAEKRRHAMVLRVLCVERCEGKGTEDSPFHQVLSYYELPDTEGLDALGHGMQLKLLWVQDSLDVARGGGGGDG